MKTFVKYSIGILAVCLSGIVFAKSPITLQSSYVDLGSDTLAATQTYVLKFDNLVKEINYRVTCKINNPSAEPVTIKVLYSPYVKPATTLNDKELTDQGYLKSGENTLKFSSVMANNSSYYGSANNSISIINADQTTNLTIKCSAQAI